MGSKSTWMIGFLGVIPVWLEKLAPSTRRQSDSFMNHEAMGVPLRPSTPHPRGCRSEIWPFPLKVVMTGHRKASANSTTASMSKRAP